MHGPMFSYAWHGSALHIDINTRVCWLNKLSTLEEIITGINKKSFLQRVGVGWEKINLYIYEIHNTYIPIWTPESWLRKVDKSRATSDVERSWSSVGFLGGDGARWDHTHNSRSAALLGRGEGIEQVLDFTWCVRNMQLTCNCAIQNDTISAI